MKIHFKKFYNTPPTRGIVSRKITLFMCLAGWYWYPNTHCCKPHITSAEYIFFFIFIFFFFKKRELDIKEGRKIRFNLRKGHIIYFFVIHNFHFHPLFIFNFVRFINLKNENYCHGYRFHRSLVDVYIQFSFSILIQKTESLKFKYFFKSENVLVDFLKS